MTEVRVGLVGTGFVAELHMYAYKRVYGVGAEVVAAGSRSDQVEAFAKKHQIAQTYRDYRALLADPAIDVVDICTPPALHAQMIVDAVRAGKHVICRSRSPAISAVAAIRHRSAGRCPKRRCTSTSWPK